MFIKFVYEIHERSSDHVCSTVIQLGIRCDGNDNLDLLLQVSSVKDI